MWLSANVSLEEPFLQFEGTIPPVLSLLFLFSFFLSLFLSLSLSLSLSNFFFSPFSFLYSLLSRTHTHIYTQNVITFWRYTHFFLHINNIKAEKFSFIFRTSMALLFSIYSIQFSKRTFYGEKYILFIGANTITGKFKQFCYENHLYNVFLIFGALYRRLASQLL